MEHDLVELPLTSDVWDAVYELARTARAHGITAPTTDIVVQACANHYGTGLLHADGHFRHLGGLASDHA